MTTKTEKVGNEAPATWAEYTWPDWVPEGVRTPIEEFWSESWGRGPRTWIRSGQEQGAPEFGAVVTMRNGFGKDDPMATGRFVHAWNNIGRLVFDDGTFGYTSFHKGMPV